MPLNLPTPSAEAKAFSAKMLAYLASEIKATGKIPFSKYMERVLYLPELGYYRSGALKFGEQGDYVTAPLISPLYSHSIAKQCQQVLQNFGKGHILELGAGTGHLALEILKYFRKDPQLLQQYFILELSSELQQRQQQLLSQEIPELLSKVRWLTTLPKEPLTGIILANEVMDAMPVHKFQIKDGIQEYYVDVAEDRLVWALDKPSVAALPAMIHALDVTFAEPYESEINLLLPGWIASLSEALKSGLILLIDYGFPRHEYYHPDRCHGTLMCHYRHHAHDNPLLLPGIQDITAHVDFTAVAEAGIANGLTVSGYTSQALFLLGCGITDFIPPDLDPLLHYQLTQQIKKLTLPSEMGELFKVIALTKNFNEALIGFSINNQPERLACRV